ncbi:MAG: 30S ribosomal protein S12 methylthiotransferase RimO [Bacteroidales bacterium]|nr:30S ribosomal protein S12 methylthiotransferase RimO [Bacteroidales bacterium]
MKINIITLGCSKNTVDSEKLAGRLTAEGHTVYFDRQKNDCDTVIVNTCGFIGDAKEESINVILEQIAAKRRRRNKTRLVVTGCLVQRYLGELKAEMPEVDEWHGTDYFSLAEPQRSLSTPSHYAYLKIAEGCNRSCSYCAIPLIRGAHRSRPIDDLVSEAKQLVASGVKELIVISQDTTYYGLDLYHRRALGELLNRLATESGAAWIRLHYTYPTSFPIDAIDAIASHPNICNYIDIPLQHINSRILSSMQRGIDREGTLRLIDTFRQKLPDVAIRTTLIVGYPGETQEEFEELKEFVRQARFDRMGCFAYSPEEGTAAYSLPDDVPQQEKERRVSELMAIQEQISLEKNQQRIGQTLRVIVDGHYDNYLVGRTQYDSPEVDDEVLIDTQTIKPSSLQAIQPGDFVDVVVTDALENDLMARLA